MEIGFSPAGIGLCLDSKIGGGKMLSPCRHPPLVLCLDSKIGGGKIVGFCFAR